MHKQTISAIILTKNEEKNIEGCLESVGWCNEIVVIDDFSEDSTVNIIQNLKVKSQNYNSKVKIFQRELKNNFAVQRNFGLEKTTSEWLLFVDADEVISDKLREEIITICQVQHDTIGYYLKRRDFFLGKWLEYGETSRVKLLRLARRDAGLWKGKVHEIWEVKGEIKELENPILHYPHQTISEFLQDINWYTDLVVQYWKEQGRQMGFWEIIIYPLGKFIKNYVFRRGFMDGTAGLILAAFMSFHSFLARSKLWMSNNK